MARRERIELNAGHGGQGTLEATPVASEAPVVVASVAEAKPEAPAVVPPAIQPIPPAIQPAPVAAAPVAAAPVAARKSGRKWLGRLVLVALLGGAAWFGGVEARAWWLDGRFMVETDDAYLSADITTLSAKVAGYVSAVEVEPNQTVRAGDVIARLDDGDFALALKSAEDRIATQDASSTRIDRQIDAAGAAVTQAEANIEAAKADSQATAAAFDRINSLIKTQVASRADLDTARAARDKAAAAVSAAEAGLAAAKANVEVLRADAAEAARTRAELVTARDKAARDLSFTVIRAPVDGVVGNRAVEVGVYVEPGQRLAAIVPLTSIHVDANFKETQLASIRAGQKVEVTVDALGGERVLEGKVESIAPATGSVFSLLPPENATGNFTKIVQRVPVRVQLPADALESGLLRPGLSVVVAVDTRTGTPPEKTAAN